MTEKASRRTVLKTGVAAGGAAAAGIGGYLALSTRRHADTELCFLTATELARRIREKAISVREVVEAHLRQIELVNSRVNAVVTLSADQARAAAREADEATARGRTLGPLHGLPVAVKDLQ